MRQLAPFLLAAAAVITLLALLTPWWTASVTMTGNQFGMSDTSHAGPFRDGGIISTAWAVITGLQVLVAFLLFAAAAAVGLLELRHLRLAALAGAGAGGLLLLLAAVLAATAWPGGDSFWGSTAMGFGNGSMAVTTYAAFGWYVALVATLVGLGGAVLQVAPGVRAADQAEPA